MKKLTFISLLLISLITNAQEKNSKIRIGMKFRFLENLSSNQITFNSNERYDISYDKFNFKVSFIGEYLISEKISLSSGVNYTHHHFTATPYTPLFINVSEDEIKLNFIEIPLSLRYSFLKKKLNPFISIGIVNQFIFDDDNLKNPQFQLKGNTFAISGKIGVGLEYNIHKVAIQLYADYIKGFTNIYNKLDFVIDYASFGLGIVKRL